MAIASAEHVFKGLGQYDFGATTRYVDVGVLRTDHYSGVPRDFRITERGTLMTDEELRVRLAIPPPSHCLLQMLTAHTQLRALCHNAKRCRCLLSQVIQAGAPPVISSMQ